MTDNKLREVLESAHHELTTLHGLFATDGFKSYSEDAPGGPREVLNVARLYISALECAVQDYRGNPTSNHLDMIRDIVPKTQARTSVTHSTTSREPRSEHGNG